MSALDDKPMVEVYSREAWRAWLEANHATSTGVWMVTARARRGQHAGLEYEAAVEEALCFGWVDSTAGVVDELRGKIYMAPRKAKSPWAASNKARVERLIRDGLMRPAGLAVIEQAKATGWWSILDGPERLDVPEDLAAALAAAGPAALAAWEAWPPSLRKQQLAQLAYAQRAETRAVRVARIADFARRGERPPA
ncbi:MAG TPA: YdeI/OmpD-associated family protein [Candidatus Limnocylindrales bacterium]|nr:YdeI/OmpD-associated family protein [Candidatus Limnocylindrales bacterium]